MSTFDIADEHEFNQKIALDEVLIEFQISINFSLSVQTFPSVHRVENLQIGRSCELEKMSSLFREN